MNNKIKKELMNNKANRVSFVVSFICFSIFYFLILVRKFGTDAIESTDSYFYLRIAELAYKRESFTNPVFSPGYSWIISLILTTGIDTELAGRITSLIFGLGTAILIFFFIREFFGEKTSTYTVIFLLANPLFAWASVSTLPYTTQTFFFWLALYLTVILGDRRVIGTFLGGIIGGYGYIVRPENILVILAVATISRRIKSLTLFLAGFLIPAIFYHILSYQEGNLPSIISKFIGYKLPEISKISETQKTSYILRELSNLLTYLQTFIANIHLFHKYIIPKILSASQIIIFGIGIMQIISSWENIRTNIIKFLEVLILWIIPIMLIVGVADYMFIPVLPIFLLICAKAIDTQPNQSNYISKFVKILVVISIILSTFQAAYPFYRDDRRKIYKLAGEWINSNLGDNILIFEPFPFATFYAKGIWITDSSKASLIIISTLDHTSIRGIPHLITLPPESIEFELLKEIDYKGAKLRIFRNKETKR